MTGSDFWPAGVALLVSSTLLAITSARALHAQSRASDLEAMSVRRLAACDSIADSLRRSRAALAPRSTDTLVRAVRSALAQANLPDSVLRSQAAAPDEALAETPNARGKRTLQSVSVTLSPLTPASLGRFLIAWRTVEPAWHPSAIRLDHVGGEADRESTYSVYLTLASVYLKSEPPEPTHH